MADASKDERNFWVHIRMGVVAAIFMAMFTAVVVRVYYLQTVQGADLLEKADVQSHRKLKLKAKRGSIVDRNGVELAVSVEAPSIAARPRLIPDMKATVAGLAPLLEMSPTVLEQKLNPKKNFVWLRRQTTPEVAEAIDALDIRGVEIHVESKRFYPLKERAGQLIGFTNIDGNGLEGLERAFDSQLAGGEFEIEGMRDARGRTLLTEATPEFRRFEGNSVVLTIDERLQRVAEEALFHQVEKHEAKGGYIAVLDVKTGDVLAMANTPQFDPNHFSKHTAAEWRLRTVTDTFEPGSTFKPFVLAGALQEGTVRLDTPIDCENGRIKIGKYTIRDSHPEQILSAAEVIKESSNIGAYKIAQSMGRDRFYDYIKGFGFGRATGVGLRGEQPGLVWPPDRWAEVSFANIAFGQGLTSTPLQVAVATGAIANGGMLMKPRIIKEIRDKDGNVIEETQPTLVRQVVSPEVAEQTAWAMSLVTREGGTATKAAMDHFTVAGKTGTAQKVNPETRRYDPDMWVGSFVGFVPAERPEIVAIVMIDEPKGTRYGGVVAAPAFKKVATEAMAIRGVRVSKEDRFEFYDEQAMAAAERALIDAEKPKQLELPAMKLPPLPEAVAEGGLPDFRGLSLREAIQQSRRFGILPSVEGWGRVVGQEPAPGTPTDGLDSIELTLSPATRQSLMAEEPSTGTSR